VAFVYRDVVYIGVYLTNCVLFDFTLVPTNYRIKASPNGKVLTDEDKNLGRWVNRWVILFLLICLNSSGALNFACNALHHVKATKPVSGWEAAERPPIGKCICVV
jgi:hypothetical protein